MARPYKDEARQIRLSKELLHICAVKAAEADEPLRDYMEDVLVGKEPPIKLPPKKGKNGGI